MGLDPVTWGLIIGGVGAASAGGSAIMESRARSEATDASRRAEAARLRQAQLEEQQRRRTLIRQAIIARSTSLANATAATGTATGSGFQGAAQSYGSQYASNVGDTNVSAAIRNDIFAANAAYSEASASAQNWGSVGQFGKDIFSSSEKLGKIFGNYS